MTFKHIALTFNATRL